jgi:tRNA 2-thiouridine synthesizing protein A
MHRMTERVKELDLRGLKCPLPVLRTRKALSRLDPGERLVVFCTDPLSRIDIPHLIHETGDMLEQSRMDGGVFVFHILRR